MGTVYKKIQFIEEKAEQVIKEAKLSARHTISEAKSNGEKLIQNKITRANAESDKILKKAEQEAQSEAQQIKEKNQQQINDLKTKVSGKISEAKKLIK
ncbi:MAG: hypothetical protein HQ564_01385 [Candidatus Saganbacteria bacterium]|nr:hypothetical protein [Candidatus Saganbacteria bacterium]